MSKRSKKQVKPFRPKTVRAPTAPQRGTPPPTPRTAVRGTLETTTDTFLSKLSPEARARLETQDQMMKEILKFVEENPEEASRLLRAWLTGKG